MSDLLHFKVATVSDIKEFFNKILIAIDRKLALVLQNATDASTCNLTAVMKIVSPSIFFKSLNTRLEFSFRGLACSNGHVERASWDVLVCPQYFKDIGTRLF